MQDETNLKTLFTFSRPSDAWVRFLIVPVLVFISLASSTTYLADFWHHLARGRYIVEEGELLNRDVFSHTVFNHPFVDVNWLTQVGYFLLFRAGGLPLVRILNALLSAATFAWLIGICWRRSGSLVAAAIIGGLTFFALWQILTIRPQTVSMFLFVVLIDICDRSRERPEWLFAAPAILALWANVHGAFPAGLILVTCHAFAAWLRDGRNVRIKLWLGVLFFCGLATLVNPYGGRIYEYVFQTSGISARRRIEEWLPPDFSTGVGVAFFLSYVVVGLLLWSWWRGKEYDAGTWLPTLAFLPLAMGSVRMAAWWMILLALPASELLGAWLPKPSESENKPTRAAFFVVVGLLLAAIFSVPGLNRYNPLFASRLTFRVEDELDEAKAQLPSRMPGPNLFARFEWGEYLSWSWHDVARVFMDGRIEIYPDDVWDDYLEITQATPEWPQIAFSRGVSMLVLDQEYEEQARLLKEVRASDDWREYYTGRRVAAFILTPAGIDHFFERNQRLRTGQTP